MNGDYEVLCRFESGGDALELRKHREEGSWLSVVRVPRGLSGRTLAWFAEPGDAWDFMRDRVAAELRLGREKDK